MADIRLPSGAGNPILLGSPAINYQLRPVAGATGVQLATMSIASATAAGGIENDFENVSPRCTADNGLPGDVDAKLRLPETLVRTENGLVFSASRGGDDPKVMFVPWGFDTGDSGANLPIANGEALTVILRYPDDGTRPYATIQVALGPLGEDVELTISMAPNVGTVQAELDALHAEDRRLENEVSSLTVGEALPALATEDEVVAGTGTLPRLFSVQRVWQAIVARVSESWLANIMSGFVREATVTDNTLTIVHVRPDGNSETITFTPTGGGGGGLTPAQARDAAGALLSTLTEFTYTAGPPAVLTFTPDPVARPTDITIEQLATTLQNVINGKLTASQVDARIFSDNGRLPESRLPKRVDDLADAWSGDDGWNANTHGLIRRVGYTVPSPANLGADLSTGYVASYLSHPRESSVYKAIALPTGDDPKLWRLRVGDFATYPGTGWTLREQNDGGRDFYVVLVTDIPVGENVYLEAYDKFTLDDPTLVGVADWAGVGNTTPIPANKLSLAPSSGGGGLDKAAVDERITTLRPNPFTTAEQAKLGRIADSAEVNPKIATDAEVDAGTSQALRSYSPALVERQIKDHVPAPQDPADNGKVATARSGAIVWDQVSGFALTRLKDGAGTGLSIPISNANHRTNFVAFSPTFDLDETLNQAGIVDIEVVLTLNTRSTHSLGFDQTSTPAITFTMSGITTASRLISSTVYSATQKNGVQIGSTATVWLGSTKLGDIEFWVAKNANNELGYYIVYAATSGNQTWAIADSIVAYFLHSDAPASVALPAVMSQAEAVAGTGTAPRQVTPQRIKQAIDALQRFTTAMQLKLHGIQAQATRVLNSDIDNRIISTARTGNTARWAKNKLPTDTVFNATQRFTTALQNKLAGIEANAESNVQSDWNATSGDALILNKPSILSRIAPVKTSLANAVNITTHATIAGRWTSWVDLEQLPAVTAQQQGWVSVHGRMTVQMVTANPSSGGERMYTEFRLLRTRGSTDTVMADLSIYGPRNMGANVAGSAASRIVSGNVAEEILAVTGDVFKIQARVQSQMANREVTFPADHSRNELTMFNIG